MAALGIFEGSGTVSRLCGEAQDHGLEDGTRVSSGLEGDHDPLVLCHSEGPG